MKRFLLCPLILSGFALLSAGSVAQAAEVAIPLKAPCNLFSAAEPIRLATKVKGFPAGAGEAEVVLTNFFKETQKKTLPVQVGADPALNLDLGVLEPGYYKAEVEIAVKGADGQEVRKKAEPVEIAVVNLVDRTAQQARKEGSRFGLKLFQIGPPGVWWRRPLVWDLRQALDASAKLGLQWTRHSLSSVQGETAEPGLIGGLELVKKHPMNVIYKIEGMPEEAYDEVRYGPLADFKTNHPRKAKYGWSRTTVPKKAPYQAWLRKQLALAPPDQDVFEIGNEVWTYMTGKEFAEWCQMVVPVVKETRPNAVLGTDPGEVSRPKFAMEFFAAGGMNGMNAIFVHPYTFAPEPETRTRQELRNQRDFLRQNTGRDFDFYVTEYGWPTVPEKNLHKSPKSVTEERQAQRTVRQSVMLYSEDMKTLIPHMMADREEIEDDWDDWFGFFRLNMQPKPVVVAHAVSAERLDSSRYVGEMDFGPYVGAFLFERGGVFTLVLWSGEGREKKLDVNVGVPELTQVDLMGRKKTVQTRDGNLPVSLTPSATYLVGVSPELEKSVIRSDAPLNPNWWAERSGEHTVPRLGTAPLVNGDLKDWQAVAGLVGEARQPLAEGQAVVWLAWDDQNLYIAGDVHDEDVSVQDKSGTSDALQVNIGTNPGRQTDMPSKALYDYLIVLSPPAGGKPGRFSIGHAGLLEPMKGTSSEGKGGVKFASQKTVTGWTVEAAIPLSLLKGFPSPAAGQKISGEVLLFDADGKGAAKKKPLLGSGDRPVTWPFLKLQP